MRSARHRHELTLQTLARDCGVPETDLSELERDQRVVTRVPTADALASRLGLSVAELAPWLLKPYVTLTDPSARDDVANLAPASMNRD
jgi:transcriptional regulator with XRE-family HTH domain